MQGDLPESKACAIVGSAMWKIDLQGLTRKHPPNVRLGAK